MEKNKKGMATKYLLSIALLTIGIFFISLFFGNIVKVFAGITNYPACTVSSFMNANMRAPFTGKEVIKFDCPMNAIEIKLKDIDVNPSDKALLEKVYGKDYFKDPKAREIFNMNRIIANQMKLAWKNAGANKDRSLFDNWWVPFGFDSPPKSQQDWKDKNKLLGIIPLPRLNDPPTFCYVAARIKFSDDVYNVFKSDDIFLNEYLQRTQFEKGSDFSLYQEFTKKIDNKIMAPNYKYKVDEPIAIVYARVNILKPVEKLEWLGQKIGLVTDPSKAEDTIYIIPFKDLEQYCTVWANKHMIEESFFQGDLSGG